MARERDLTISEELELKWNDGKYTEDNEKAWRHEFEEGWKDLSTDVRCAGHNILMFDPMQLVV